MAVTDGLEVFVEICEAGSISAAARKLGIPRPTVSRHLAQLEEELGVRLLRRSTRRMVRTPAGEELLRRARRVVAGAREAREAVRTLDGVPRGLLRVSMPPAQAIPPAVFLSFIEQYPQVDLELVGAVRLVDLVGEGFDVAIRGAPLRDSELVGRILYKGTVRALASKAYLQRRGRPKDPSELANHCCLRGFERGEVPQTAWPLKSGGSVPVGGRLVTNSLELLLASCQAGVGIAMLPQMPGTEGLEVVLEDSIGFATTLSVVYPERAFLEPKVRAFVDHLVASDLGLPTYS